jgi:hypothetical protein
VEEPEDQRGGTVKGVGEKVFRFAEADHGASTPSLRHLRLCTMYPLPHLHKVSQLEGILLVAEMSTRPFAVYEMDNEGFVLADHSAKCSWTVRQERLEYGPSVELMSDSFCLFATVHHLFLMLRYSKLHCLYIPDRRVLSAFTRQGTARKGRAQS